MPKFLVIVALIALFLIGFFASSQTLSTLYKNFLVKTSPVVNYINKTECDDECKKIIASEVGKALSSQSPTPNPTLSPTIVKNTSPVQTPKAQVSYIPFGADGSTQSTEWVDVPANEVSFDLAVDYSKNAKAAWEASLRVDNANGTAYARIFDVTHGIAVDGSEISVTDSSSFNRVSSGNLNFWSGRNIYRVQVKSLNSSGIFYSGGKIRITY